MRDKSVRSAALIMLAVSLVLGPFASAASLKPHTAVYKVKISVLSGRLNTRLTTTDAGYMATHTIAPTGFARALRKGSIEESSVFVADDGGVQPLHYRSSDTLAKTETHADIAFDWATGAISGTVNGADFHGLADEFAHDRISIQYELMHDLLNGGADPDYVLFEIDEFKTLNVSVIGSREVKTPAGRFDAVGIQHQASGSSRVTTLWCVAQLDYLPVIIEQHKNGKLRMRATLEEYSPEPL